MSDFKFSDYIKPVANGVFFEDVKEFKQGDTTESGLIIVEGDGSSTPEADGDSKQHLGIRVVAVGPDVDRVKEGDIIMLEPQRGVIGMELFGNKYYFASDYTIMAVLSTNADDKHRSMKAEKAKIKQELATAKRNKFLNIDNSKLDLK